MEVPFTLVNSPKTLELIPIMAGERGNVLVRDVGTVKESTMPGEIDRYNMKRIVSMTGNIQDGDLGDVARQIVGRAGSNPRVVHHSRGGGLPYRPRRRRAGFGHHEFAVDDQLAEANFALRVDLLHATEQ